MRKALFVAAGIGVAVVVLRKFQPQLSAARQEFTQIYQEQVRLISEALAEAEVNGASVC